MCVALSHARIERARQWALLRVHVYRPNHVFVLERVVRVCSEKVARKDQGRL